MSGKRAIPRSSSRVRTDAGTKSFPTPYAKTEPNPHKKDPRTGVLYRESQKQNLWESHKKQDKTLLFCYIRASAALNFAFLSDRIKGAEKKFLRNDYKSLTFIQRT